jgi:hypothetical protein
VGWNGCGTTIATSEGVVASLWPWLAVAGFGALHGLNPATGWMFAAAWGVHSRDRVQALRALLPIAVGHALSVGVVTAAVVFGISMDRIVLQALVGAVLVLVAICHLFGAGLALWSFIMSTAHGAGLMLVPALMPLCIGNVAAQEVTVSGSFALVLAAVAVHTAAMIAVTGLIAIAACRGFDAALGFLRLLQSSTWVLPMVTNRTGPMERGSCLYSKEAVTKKGSRDDWTQRSTVPRGGPVGFESQRHRLRV